MKIVIVEDEKNIREELRVLLESAAYEVTAVEEFGTVLAQIESENPDLVLLDVNLPGQNGREICKKVRQATDVPIIFVTSDADVMAEINGMLAGGDDYITKPYHPSLLLARITAVLKRTGKKRPEESYTFTHNQVTLDIRTYKLLYKEQHILWSKIPVALSDHSLTDAKVTEYKDRFSFAKVSNIDDYIDQSFGSMTDAIQKASYASIAATILLSILVTLLFMKMLVAKDRYSISVLKSLGFTSEDIRRQYMTRSIIVLVLGVVIGTVLANTLGELVGVALISSFGAATFHFDINPWFAYLFSPLLIAACVMIATLFGVSGIRTLKVSEYIKE